MKYGTVPGAVLAATAMVAALSAAPAAAAEKPDYGRFHEGVFLRYLNAEGGEIDKSPRIGLSFGDRVLHAVLDSGSTGIVVASAFIPGVDQLPVVGDGRLTYTSSGRVMLGRWVTTPLSLVGEDGAQVTTEPMPVLAVDEVRCLEEARDCRPNDDPRDIAMVGIGFGREADAQTQSTPDKNPLLRVQTNGEQRRGYVLTADGVHVGLTGSNTRGDFRFVKLERQADLPDWKAVPACISVNGQTPAACGTMLADTGVAAMFLTLPASQVQSAGDPLPDGTDVAIALSLPEGQAPLYDFKVGDSSPLAPDTVHLRTSDDRVFVNTSFHLLNGFDFLYDSDGGFAAFKRR